MDLCPLCCGTFASYQLEHVDLDLCTTCGAVWFDKGELTDLIGTKVGGQRRGIRRSCPNCAEPQLRWPPCPDVSFGVYICSSCEGCLLSRERYEDLVARPPAQDYRPVEPTSEGWWLITALGEFGIGLLSHL